MKRKRYYSDALAFTQLLTKNAIPALLPLLSSKSKSDITETMLFFMEASRRNVTGSKAGIQRMVHLVWVKDVGGAEGESKSVREYLLTTFKSLFIDDCFEQDEKEWAKAIVTNLIQ